MRDLIEADGTNQIEHFFISMLLAIIRG